MYPDGHHIGKLSERVPDASYTSAPNTHVAPQSPPIRYLYNLHRASRQKTSPCSLMYHCDELQLPGQVKGTGFFHGPSNTLCTVHSLQPVRFVGLPIVCFNKFGNRINVLVFIFFEETLMNRPFLRTRSTFLGHICRLRRDHKVKPPITRVTSHQPRSCTTSGAAGVFCPKKTLGHTIQ